MIKIKPGRDVQATINYSRSSTTEKWFIDTISCPNGNKITNAENDPISTTIHDLRGVEHNFSLDKNGFQAIFSPTSVPSNTLLSGGDVLKTVYYPEVEKLLMEVTGADKAVAFDHTIRQSQVNSETWLHRLPVMRAHVDQTPKSAWGRIALHSPEVQSFYRFQIINVWRPIVNIVYDYPLTMADFRSLNLHVDLMPTDLRYPEVWVKDKETYSVKWNRSHAWYYWSCMTPDEVLMAKCYDSASQRLAEAYPLPLERGNRNLYCSESVAGLAPHTAFYDEKASMKGSGRKSIEIRTLVFYK
ncbi:hydroxylase/desaturase CTB9 [Folsomia candida]|nr:hydroxylase/desaturase CTB9 [Folsomia candida]